MALASSHRSTRSTPQRAQAAGKAVNTQTKLTEAMQMSREEKRKVKSQRNYHFEDTCCSRSKADYRERNQQDLRVMRWTTVHEN